LHDKGKLNIEVSEQKDESYNRRWESEEKTVENRIRRGTECFGENNSSKDSKLEEGRLPVRLLGM
jgi:hypothetical protein